MHLSKEKALYGCTALMFMMVGVNLPNALGDADFKGWYLGFALSLPLVVRHFRLTVPTVWLIVAIALPTIVGYATGNFVSFKGLFTTFLFLLLVLYARALVTLLGHEKLIRVYATVGVAHALLVIFNEFIYLASPALSFSLFGATEPTFIFTRAQGAFLEPSEAAFYLTPALAYYALNRNHIYASIVLMAMIATFSALAYISIALIFLLIMLLRKISVANLVKFALMGFLLVAVAATSEQIANRFESIVHFIAASTIDFDDYNSSIATIIMNSIVARDSLFGTNFLGLGFGNFEYGFNLYAPNYFPQGYDDTWGLFWNRNTGGNLLIRLTAELGFIGIFLIMYVLSRAFKAYSFCRSKGVDGEFVCSRNHQAFIVSAVVIFLICLLRKDSVTNIHLAIFLLGMLRFSAKKWQY